VFPFDDLSVVDLPGQNRRLESECEAGWVSNRAHLDTEPIKIPVFSRGGPDIDASLIRSVVVGDLGEAVLYRPYRRTHIN
jgi:hypothetical protein